MNPQPFPGQVFFVHNARCKRDDICSGRNQRGNGILMSSPYWTRQALMAFLTTPCRRCGSVVSVDTEISSYAKAEVMDQQVWTTNPIPHPN